MRIGIASAFACAAGMWMRLAAEGADVRVWVEDKQQKRVGDGLIPKAGSWPEVLQWCKDGTRAGIPTLLFFDSSGLGEKADEARRAGVLVVGGGAFCDRLEKDRLFGQRIAQEAGCALPPYQEFSSFAECRQWARGHGDVPVYWKSDRFLESDATHSAKNGAALTEYLDSVIRRFGAHGKCVVQQKIDGVAFSTARWWNGRAFVGPYEGTIERKKAHNDDKGPATGCAFNALWFYDDEPEIAVSLGFPNLAPAFLKNQAPPGIYDINAVADADGNAYFLEFTPRCGYDSEPTSMNLTQSFSGWLYAIATGTHLPQWSEDLACSLRLGIPPYPWEHAEKDMKRTALGVEIRGLDDLHPNAFIPYELANDPEAGLICAAPEGIVGIAYAQGEPLAVLCEQCEETADAIYERTPGLIYRTDAADALGDDAEKLTQSGFAVHPGLLR
jgi:phosphoribosylamine---glycine ligase